ncbi:MAG: tetratricopeptide repeat protein, partial [Myxococcota bacterium]
KNPGETLGFSSEALDTVERMARAYYRTHQFGKAAVIYGFVLQMNIERATGWRGLGACAMAQREYGHAGQCFKEAIRIDPQDVPSKVFLGECMCQVGAKEVGVELLRDTIKQSTERADYRPYITRARAIVGHDGGIPNTLILRRHGEALVREATEEMAAEEAAAVGYDPADADRDIEFNDIKKNPKLLAAIRELATLVDEDKLTYAQVGGFTDNELDGAYAVACKYAELGEVTKSIQIAGYLIFLDPHKARYYQLVGICLQRMKQYEGADFYYRMANIFEPSDPMTLVYRGECKIMAGRVDEGLVLVRQGQAAASADPAAQPMADRADVLIKQFGGGA